MAAFAYEPSAFGGPMAAFPISFTFDKSYRDTSANKDESTHHFGKVLWSRDSLTEMTRLCPETRQLWPGIIQAELFS